jgi:hypothetical protein
MPYSVYHYSPIIMLTRSSSSVSIQTASTALRMPTEFIRETRSSSQHENTRIPIQETSTSTHSPYITRAMRRLDENVGNVKQTAIFGLNSVGDSRRRLERSGERVLTDTPIHVQTREVLHPSDNITYAVDIDFDEASREWNRNKRRAGHSYVYVCGYMCASGNPCKRSPSAGCEHCCVHNK